MKKKLLATLLVLCMILPSFGGLSALALDIIDMGDNATLICDNPYNKIHFYFDNPDNATIDDAAELQAATAAVKGDYAAALMAAEGDGEVNENVYITVQFASDYMETNEYEVFKAALESATTPEMRDTVKTQRNTFSKRYHAAIIEENLPILAQIPYTAVNAIDYSSFVTLTVPAAQLDVSVLAEVAENKQILHLSISNGEDLEVGATLDDITLSGISAQLVVGNQMYTGEGIKIGVYEGNNITKKIDGVDVAISNYLNEGHPNLSNLSHPIIIRDGDSGTPEIDVITHATKVTSVVTTLVPDAQIYFSRTRKLSDGTHEGLAYFIDQGCDIVNCSMGYVTGCYRYDYDAIFDEQIRTHGIIAVASAGNYDEDDPGYILSPAHAHNIITVGGVNYSSTEGGWIHATSYMYEENGGKPNISAPYTVTIPNIGRTAGTSISAPIVTSCIAMLKEKYAGTSQFWLHPERITSLMLATADRTVDYDDRPAPLRDQYHFDKRIGAGVLNLQRLLGLSQYSYTVYTSNSSGVSSSEVVERSVNLTQGQTIQLGLSWLASTDASVQAQNCTDYDLYIYDSTDFKVALSIEMNSSCEMIRYTVPQTGTYRIVVQQQSARNQADYIALTYNLS